MRPYPISIEWPVHWLAEQVASVAECRKRVRRELGLADDALLGVGIDRLDYTKGIEERLSAVDELLTRYPEFRGRFTFVQLAAPSRTKIPSTGSSTSASRLSRRASTPSGRPGPTDPSCCCARTTSRRRCFATTAPRSSAT